MFLFTGIVCIQYYKSCCMLRNLRHEPESGYCQAGPERIGRPVQLFFIPELESGPVAPPCIVFARVTMTPVPVFIQFYRKDMARDF